MWFGLRGARYGDLRTRAEAGAWLVRATPVGRGRGASCGFFDKRECRGFPPIQLSITAKGGPGALPLAYSSSHTVQSSWRG